MRLAYRRERSAEGTVAVEFTGSDVAVGESGVVTLDPDIVCL
jgi:hypothetical protein